WKPVALDRVYTLNPEEPLIASSSGESPASCTSGLFFSPEGICGQKERSARFFPQGENLADLLARL
ncbi:MAG: hypothetical protein ACTJF3_14225, partial [Glutamicibacter arilaitensis]